MTQPSKASKTQPHRSGAGFGILLSLLIASAAAITSYWTWQQSNIRDEVQDELERGVTQLLHAIEKQQEEINQRFKIEQQQKQNYNVLQQRLIALESKLEQANQPLKVDHWSIAETLYLINIAEHLYRLEQNSLMARSALGRAREQLLEHSSAETSAVVDELSRLIARIEGEDSEVRNRQMGQLETLYLLIPKLPIATSTFVVEPGSAASNYSLKSIEGWRQYRAALWHDIQQLFRINPPDSEKGQPITADLYPLLRQQLVLKIDFARLALMSNSPLYISTVKEIKGLLSHYFDRESELIREQLAILEQIVATGESELPDINFDAVRQHLAAPGKP